MPKRHHLKIDISLMPLAPELHKMAHPTRALIHFCGKVINLMTPDVAKATRCYYGTPDPPLPS